MKCRSILVLSVLGTFGTARAAEPVAAPPSHAFALGGGVAGFVRDDQRLGRARAAAWTLTYSYSPASTVAWELVYTGAMDLTRPATTDDDQVFLGALEGDMRVNLFPIEAVYPFVFGGVGYAAFQRQRIGSNGFDPTTLTVPLGGGIEVLAGDVALQGRFAYRPALFDESVDLAGTGADGWSLVGTVGSRF